MPKELTNKQQAFCREYLKDFNATQAAKRAGYSDKTSYSQGQRLLKKAEVKIEIAGLLSEIEAISTVEVAEIVAELRKLAFNRLGFLNNADKLRALELLGRYKAMFTDVHRETTEPIPKRSEAEQQAIADLARQYKLRLAQEEPQQATG